MVRRYCDGCGTRKCASMPRNSMDMNPWPPNLLGANGERLILRGRLGFNTPGRWSSDLSTLKYRLWSVKPSADGSGYEWHRDDGAIWEGRLTYYEAVALTASEAEFPCGILSLEELHQKLQYFWPVFIKQDYDIERLGVVNSEQDAQASTRWYTSWLKFFIEQNHCFGFAHAWVAALTLQNVQDEATSMLFELNPEDCDTSLCTMATDFRAELLITNEQGLELISNPESHNPRRVWDLCANKVIPGAWMRVRSRDDSWLEAFYTSPEHVWIVSHSWTAEDDRDYIFTPVNNYQWPVPMPKNVTLDHLRHQLLGFGCRYAWVDVLCLRQAYTEPLRVLHGMHSSQEREKREALRAQEWKTDVPTIGHLYMNFGKAVPTIVYFNGLGRPFQHTGYTSERHWLNRAWTIQETRSTYDLHVGGLTPDIGCPWQSKVDDTTTLGYRINEIDKALLNASIIEMIRLMDRRYASNPIDKIAGISAIFQPPSTPIPIYDWNETQSEGWHRWLYTMETALLHVYGDGECNQNFFHLLLCTFPLPSSNHWFPSWQQVIQYPILSAPDLVTTCCSIKSSPNPEGLVKTAVPSGFSALTWTWQIEKIYRCFLLRSEDNYVVRQRVVGSESGEEPITLTSATPDGVLYDSGVDPDTQYILVDITPGLDLGLLPWTKESRIVIVCREINGGIEDIKSLTCSPAPDQPPTLYLQRVTTLLWRYGSDYPRHENETIKIPLTPAIDLTNDSGSGKVLVRLK